MNFSDCRKFIGSLLFFTAAISIACNSAASSLSEVPKAATQSPAQTEPTATPFVEPFSSLDADKSTNGLRESWRRFTASGQYRLAQFSDMRFSDGAKTSLARNIGSTNPISFVYIWGDLNYNKRIEDDHLAAIVVDTTKQDDNRFSLVIFSPPKGKKDVYETHWFYRDRDLSKTTVNRASGYFYVTEYFDDGTQKSCSVIWNPKQNRFECERLK